MLPQYLDLQCEIIYKHTPRKMYKFCSTLKTRTIYCYSDDTIKIYSSTKAESVKWVSIFSYIKVCISSYFSTRWCSLMMNNTLSLICIVYTPVKQYSTGKHVVPLGPIILIPVKYSLCLLLRDACFGENKKYQSCLLYLIAYQFVSGLHPKTSHYQNY